MKLLPFASTATQKAALTQDRLMWYPASRYGPASILAGADQLVPFQRSALPEASSIPMQKDGEVHDTAASRPAGASMLAGAENFMAGQTVPVADTALVPPGPVTFSVRMYFVAAVPLRAGSLTGTWIWSGVERAAHGLVTGSPATAGVAEIVQVAERLTRADRVVVPPAEGRAEGCMATWVTAGAASRTTTVTGLAAALPPLPLATSPNL